MERSIKFVIAKRVPDVILNIVLRLEAAPTVECRVFQPIKVDVFEQPDQRGRQSRSWCIAPSDDSRPTYIHGQERPFLLDS
jgi:hypothetical protein